MKSWWIDLGGRRNSERLNLILEVSCSKSSNDIMKKSRIDVCRAQRLPSPGGPRFNSNSAFCLKIRNFSRSVDISYPLPFVFILFRLTLGPTWLRNVDSKRGHRMFVFGGRRKRTSTHWRPSSITTDSIDIEPWKSKRRTRNATRSPTGSWITIQN